MQNKGLVVDLDYTFINSNSFTYFVKWLGANYINKVKFHSLFKLLLVIAKRKLRLISHSEAKLLILKIYDIDRLDILPFVEILKKNIDKNIFNIIQEYKSFGYITCLATAAPCVYSEILAKVNNIDMCICTSMSLDTEWKENIREEKFNNVKTKFDNNKIEISVVITDHYDDLLLVKNAKEKAIVVRANDLTKKMLKNYDKVKII